MVEAGGISEGGWATAGEDMDGTPMADCGGRTRNRWRRSGKGGGGSRDMI